MYVFDYNTINMMWVDCHLFLFTCECTLFVSVSICELADAKDFIIKHCVDVGCRWQVST